MKTFFCKPGPAAGCLILSVMCLLLLYAQTAGRTPDDAIFYFCLFRGLLGFFTGGCLALSGLIFQAVFRNPLADPYIMGVSSGAATGAALAFICGSGELLFCLVPAGAFCGALATLGLVILIAGRTRGSSQDLLLSGVITGIIISSCLIYLISVSDSEQLAGVTWWILGDLQGGSLNSISALAVLALSTLAFLRFFANDLNTLALGDEIALTRGVSVRKMQLVFIVAATLLAAGSVSLAGIIGFTGLAVPHAIRMLFGSDHRKILLPAFLAGGGFLQLCDFAAAMLSGVREMPVGVTTACIGGLLFLHLLAKQRSCR